MIPQNFNRRTNVAMEHNVDMWKECLRVLKPGGFLLSFGGTRTYHRIACAIEDAGFEIRDMIEWVYGSGFPKSLNIGKAVDKLGGQSLSWFIDYVLEVADEKGISRKELTMLFPSKNGNPTGWLWNKQKTQGITIEQYHKIKEFLQLPFPDITECEREVVGRGKAGLTAGTIANFAGEKEFDLTKGTSEWEGWGTALKPAHEPICMARKPLSEKTVAENCLKWGTGGININDCKVKFNIDIEPNTGDSYYLKRNKKYPNKGSAKIMGSKSKRVNVTMTQGRFPANLIHDGSDEVLEYFPQSKGACSQNNSSNINIYKGNSFNKSASKLMGYRDWYNDNGSAARFFYCAKASKTERNMGCEELEEKRKDENRNENFDSIQSRLHGSIPKKNNHPTVKPIKLMEYLIKLVSREGSLIYDPFAGSGSTLIAAKKLGRNFIGSEINPDYVKIAENRISKEIHFKEAT